MTTPQNTAPGFHHVAFIMDGNGRWATNQGWPRLVVHRKGAERVRAIVADAPDLGIHWLTLYAFSTENWKRSTEEVLGLMALFAHTIEREATKLANAGVRVRFIGDRGRLSPKLQNLMAGIEARTAAYDRLNLTIAINYGGRDEIVRAARQVAQDVAQGLLAACDLTESAFAERLDTAGLPDPDLVIRTSGETRTSNFCPGKPPTPSTRSQTPYGLISQKKNSQRSYAMRPHGSAVSGVCWPQNPRHKAHLQAQRSTLLKKSFKNISLQEKDSLSALFSSQRPFLARARH